MDCKKVETFQGPLIEAFQIHFVPFPSAVELQHIQKGDVRQRLRGVTEQPSGIVSEVKCGSLWVIGEYCRSLVQSKVHCQFNSEEGQFCKRWNQLGRFSKYVNICRIYNSVDTLQLEEERVYVDVKQKVCVVFKACACQCLDCGLVHKVITLATLSFAYIFV